MSNEQQKKLEINLHPDVAPGVYSNLALIAHSKSDFIIDFIANLPGMAKPDVVSRVVMTPEHAKRLLAALNDNIGKYEQQFGVIGGEQKDVNFHNPFNGNNFS